MVVEIIFFMRLSVDQINVNKEFINEYKVFNFFVLDVILQICGFGYVGKMKIHSSFLC